jgi:hypothetical protein
MLIAKSYMFEEGKKMFISWRQPVAKPHIPF